MHNRPLQAQHPCWGYLSGDTIQIEIFLHFQVHCLLQTVQPAFHPQGYVQAEGKLCGQHSTGRDTLRALRGFPVCLPCSSFCVSLSFTIEMKQICLGESKNTGGEPGLWRSFISNIHFSNSIRGKAKHKSWFVSLKLFILLWRSLFKKAVLGYTQIAGRRVWAYCFLLPPTAYFSVK